MNNNEDLNKYLRGVEDYKKDQAAHGSTIELEMPSTAQTGLKWVLLPIRVDQYAISGKLPMHLIGKLSAARGSSPEAVMSTMTEADRIQFGLNALLIVKSVMLENLIFPRITLEPTEGAITPEQIRPDDFEFFTHYVLRGGQADANPKSQPAAGKRK